MMQITKLADQPAPTDLRLVDGIFVKATTFLEEGMIAPQHAHEYDHISAIVSGAVRLDKGGVLVGDYYAPAMIRIEARVKHLFYILEPNTTIWCIHNADRAAPGEVAIHSHHELDAA